MRINQLVHVHRLENGDFQIRWPQVFINEPLNVYVSDNADDFDLASPVLTGVLDEALITGLDHKRRHYFLLKPEHGQEVIVAERLLPLKEGVNFRDFGGYPAANGRRLRWGCFYRSGYMSQLTATDVEYLATLGIQFCCDFRAGAEIQRDPSLLPEQTKIIGLSISPGSMGSYWKLMANGEASGNEMPQVMQQLNVELAENHTAEYGEMLARLCAMESGALLVNCSAGKDRTGFGVALIMMALGVPREAIIHDYLLSHKYFHREKEMYRLMKKYSDMSGVEVNADILMPMMEAREEYLLSALDHIQNNYGTAESYLKEKFSLNAAELGHLRDRFTH